MTIFSSINTVIAALILLNSIIIPLAIGFNGVSMTICGFRANYASKLLNTAIDAIDHSNANVDPSEASTVAAASAATVSLILSAPNQFSHYQDALDIEKEINFDGENEYQESEDDDFLWKDVDYSDEMAAEMDQQLPSYFQEEAKNEIYATEKMFDIGKNSNLPIKKISTRPKRYKHLFRYNADISVACWLATTKSDELFQSCGYDKEDIERISLEFPKIFPSEKSNGMDTKNLLAPKLRFLVNVLGGGTGDIGNGLTSIELEEELSELEPMEKYEEGIFIPHNLRVSKRVRKHLPIAAFFNPRLETTIAPRHGYLAFHRDTLPYGKELIHSTSESEEMPILNQFLNVCTKDPAEFASLCNEWQAKNIANRSFDNISRPKVHTSETVAAMDYAFAEGLLPFARNEGTLGLETAGIDCTPSKMVSLLLNHGANYAEHDDWGSTALHWAAGAGNLGGVQALVNKMEQDEEAIGGDVRDVLWNKCASCSTTRDGATPLHWASCGVNHTHFGCGGHTDVCRYFLERAGKNKQALANSLTFTGNTPLMWASWSGSLDVAKLLVSEGQADPYARNNNGFTAAHWAASGGHLNVCRYLHEELGLAFVGKNAENEEGDTPMSVAISYARAGVVEWISSHVLEIKIREQ